MTDAERIKQLEDALRPFAEFEETLRPWHEGKFDPPWSQVQAEWPFGRPVLERSRPVGKFREGKRIERAIFRSHFETAAKLLGLKNG